MDDVMKNRMKVWLCGLTACAVSTPALALRNMDMSGDDVGATAVYTFATDGSDSSNSGTALNLTASNDGNLPSQDGTPILTNAFYINGSLMINHKPNGSESGANYADQGYQSAMRHRSFLVSDTASKLNDMATCGKEFTIQAFLRPHFPFQGANEGNLIVGLTNSTNMSATVASPNFGIYQTGGAGTEAVELRVRQSNGQTMNQTSAVGAFSSVREFENPGVFTEVIATMDTSGTMTVYMNRVARSSIGKVTPAYLANAKLVIGNDLVPITEVVKQGVLQPELSQQRNWSGEISHMAIYCHAYSRADILGTVALNKATTDVVKPGQGGVSDTKVRARRMIERLIGGPIPIDHPMVARVEAKILANDATGAAKIVTGDTAAGEPGHPDFLNVTVKQMALKMSNHEETIRASLNDFVADVVGITRDDRNAKELLTEDFYYMGDPAKTNVRHDMYRDLVMSNNHYDDLDSGHWDLGKVLVRMTGQKIATTISGGLAASPDPAGVITSRAFMSAHAIAGTNRRMVEYSFREFMCVPMSEMADTSASPARIGRDIDRLPGGDAMKFETSCKGCHTVMDGFRGAFAHWDFASVAINNVGYNFTRNTQVNAAGDQFGFPMGTSDGNGVVRKMTHNENNFPNGFLITDDSFVNNAVGSNNKGLFGWRGAQARGGFGANQFGRMIADSSRYSQCMAKRVFESVCRTGLKSESKVSPLIQSLAQRFEDGGYKLRSLFQDAAANPACASGAGR